MEQGGSGKLKEKGNQNLSLGLEKVPFQIRTVGVVGGEMLERIEEFYWYLELSTQVSTSTGLFLRERE